MKNKTAVVLGGGPDQQVLVQSFKNRGFRTVIIDYLDNPSARSVADYHYQESTYDTEAACRITSQEKASVIATCSTDQPLVVAAYAADRLGITFHLNPLQARQVTNKEQMKSIMVRHGITTSRYMIIDGTPEKACADNFYAECEKKLSGLRYPLIIKPVDSSGSRGIHILKDNAEFREYLPLSVESSASSMVLVEEYLEGDEISVDAIVVGGKAQLLMITDNHTFMNPDGKPLFYRSEYPSRISNSARDFVARLCQQIADAFGLQDAPLFFQALVSDDNVHVLEMSARIAGGSKPAFIKRAVGVDLVDLYVSQLLKEPFDVKPSYRAGVIFLNYLYCRPGTLAHISRPDSCNDNSDIDEILQYKQSGSQVGGLGSGSDRVGAFFIGAENRRQAIEKSRDIIRNIGVMDIAGNDILIRDIEPDVPKG